ncbi:MAG: DUF58 domain-containing protein [Acidobacteriota bacterium]
MSTPQTANDRRDIAELLRRVRRLELIGRHNAAGLRPGDYSTKIRGSGLIFEEPRKYVPGDEARRIDWNITARLGGVPHVRVHSEERQREVLLLLDVSPSMHFGSRRLTKLETAVELAATLAVSTVHAGDRLGFVTFADRVLSDLPPREGRAQLFRVLRSMLDDTRPWRRPVAQSDPRTAIHAVERRRGRFSIFLISDFIDHDIPDDLRYLRARHDVTLLHVFDPLEYADPEGKAPVSLRARSPEGDRRPASRPWGQGESVEALQSWLRQRCGELRMDFASLPTTEAAPLALGPLFKRRR